MTEVITRPNQTKAFALSPGQMDGASIQELFEKDLKYKEAKDLHSMCTLYAAAYNETMLKRLEKEKPEFYEENNIDKHEMIAHLVNNMCLPYSKYRSKVYRDSVADDIEHKHTTDTIRRLNNGGDKFHPYF